MTQLTVSSRWARRRSARPASLVAGAVLALLVTFAIAGPLVWPEAATQDLDRYLHAPTWSEPWGRDDFGRDITARLAHATRLSLVLSALCVATALLVGGATGILAAWAGGWCDTLLRGIAETASALPALLIVLLVSALAASGALWPLYLGIAVAASIEYFRVVRSRASRVLATDAVEAARLLDLGRWHIVRRHLWPDLRPTLVTLASLGMVTSILAMSTLGFVKVGVQPPRTELGLMLSEALPFSDVAPWMALAPVTVLFALTLSLWGLRSQEVVSR
ncbi:ABC transporter permease [Knoellia sp. CPCC 206453]|uniref:ABC transporter permease n=1 Tax=Knoellia pratensis TaxID=3404796 RepID=UPI003613FCD8